MRHRVAHRKLGRVTEHRIAMLRNQATALLRHEHLTTTVPRAKELRPFVERLITIAKRGLADGNANARALNARRLIMHDVQDREVVSKLFDTLAPRFETRPGGYTRILKLGHRDGDRAELAIIELVDNPREIEAIEAEKKRAKSTASKKKKSSDPKKAGAKKEDSSETADSTDE